eukprot:5259632-Prymnesium_polylepis.1
MKILTAFARPDMPLINILGDIPRPWVRLNPLFCQITHPSLCCQDRLYQRPLIAFGMAIVGR